MSGPLNLGDLMMGILPKNEPTPPRVGDPVLNKLRKKRKLNRKNRRLGRKRQ